MERPGLHLCIRAMRRHCGEQLFAVTGGHVAQITY
jgi:hypothetical protein